MQTRPAEFALSALMLGVGVALAAPGDTFSLPHYADMRGSINEDMLGHILSAFGSGRMFMLVVNGHVFGRRTPVLRLLGCCLSAFFWGFIASSILEVRWEGVPLVFAVGVVCVMVETVAGCRNGFHLFTQDSLNLRLRKRGQVRGVG